MTIKITLYCPDCQSAKIKKNGKKSCKKQNYFCKNCKRQFIGDHCPKIPVFLEGNAYFIAELYKQRWEIELFFKFIKQHLNVSNLVSRTENGIKVMLYVTMILAMLTIVYKKKNNIKSFKIAKPIVVCIAVYICKRINYVFNAFALLFGCGAC